MNYETLLTVTTGPVSNPVNAQVEFSGKLTKAAAKAAAEQAFGHAVGVTVTDDRDGTCYHFTASGGRKVKMDPEQYMDMSDYSW